MTENYTTTGEATLGAVPGAVANVPGANADLPGGEGTGTESSITPSTTDYERTESTSNFEVPQTVTVETEAPGGVERLSVSRVIDESVPAEQAAALSDLVAAAVGLDSTRGDEIVMAQIPFDRSVTVAAADAFAAAEGTETILTYARIALPVLVLLIAFFFFRMLMKSISRREYQVNELPMEYATALAGGTVPALAGGTAVAGMLPAGTPLALAEEPPDPEEMKSDLERQVTKLAESHPDTVAEVVQSWLRED